MTLHKSKLGIIAGSGELPLQIARACDANGRAYHVIATDEFASDMPASIDHTRVPMSKLGRCVRVLHANGCEEIVFAGKFARPRDQKIKLRPDWHALMFLVTNFGVLRGSNDEIHRAIANTFSGHGFTVVSPVVAAPDLAARQGCTTALQPDVKLATSFQEALKAASEHGRSRQGQAIVFAGGKVVAKEGRAGTDAMLKELPADVSREAFLVKAMAPNQLATMDPPAIGEDTVEIAADAGLAGILIEAGRCIVVDPERVRSCADGRGIFVFAETISS